ncbi:MAG: hypothetical protein Q9202_003759 [Teloschistes flavicans]
MSLYARDQLAILFILSISALRTPFYEIMASYPNSTFGTSTPTFLNPRAPPPPPPKSTRPPTPSRLSSQQQLSAPGPPLPPPPTIRPDPKNHPQHTPASPPPPEIPAPQPSQTTEPWLPELLLDKPTKTLESTLHNPPLLTALTHTHPLISPSPLPPHISQTHSLATHVLHAHHTLLAHRAATQSKLLQLRALERQWRTKQAEVDEQLAPWGAKNLYQRLGRAEREGGEWCRGLEESFMVGGDGGRDGGGGKVGEREVGEFVRRFREGRRGLGRRGEERARWDEGRVGGWR